VLCGPEAVAALGTLAVAFGATVALAHEADGGLGMETLPAGAVDLGLGARGGHGGQSVSAGVGVSEMSLSGLFHDSRPPSSSGHKS